MRQVEKFKLNPGQGFLFLVLNRTVLPLGFDGDNDDRGSGDDDDNNDNATDDLRIWDLRHHPEAHVVEA